LMRVEVNEGECRKVLNVLLEQMRRGD
jgi:hypothetical protein